MRGIRTDDSYEDGGFEASKTMTVTRMATPKGSIAVTVGIFEAGGGRGGGGEPRTENIYIYIYIHTYILTAPPRHAEILFFTQISTEPQIQNPHIPKSQNFKIQTVCFLDLWIVGFI